MNKNVQRKETKGLLGTYHRKIQLKHIQMKAHRHERPSKMLQSTLIIVIRFVTSDNHAVHSKKSLPPIVTSTPM